MSNTNHTTPRAWYGSWPPKIYTEREDMKLIKRWWRNRPLTYAMAIVLLFGIILILMPYIKLGTTTIGGELSHDLGIGFIVASILGVTIDQFLSKQLAEDAFKASIGYLLPNELRGEMEWIYGQKILCIQHIQTSELKPIRDNPDICELNTTLQRTYKNISPDAEDIVLGGGWGGSVFDWYYKDYSSDILSFTYTKDGEVKILEKEYGEYGHIGVKEEKFKLSSGDTVTTVMKAREIKRTSDLDSWAFYYPTINPQVTFKSYEGIKIRLIFGYRKGAQKLSEDTYILQGLLLQGQRLNIQWAREADEKLWRETHA